MIRHKTKIQPNLIVAQLEISESEIIKVMPDYDASFELNNPTQFKLMLYGLGVDISQHHERHDSIQHRNRFNEIVVCSRWVGSERLDEQWLNSGYASKAAKDKASGCKLLEDSYRARQMTEDVQSKLNERDSRIIKEEVEE